MQRRDFVKAMVAAAVAAQSAAAQQPVALPAQAAKAPAPEPWMRGLLDIKPLPMTPLVPDAVAQSKPSFFSESQTATLHKLCEIFEPPYENSPGAIDAGVVEFMDFLLGASPKHRQQLYTSGLDRLDSESRERFHLPFSKVSPDQADLLLRPWLRSWMSDHPPTESYAQFINVAHQEIRMATVNSEAYSEAARAAGRPSPNIDLYWYPVDPDLNRSRLQGKTSN